MTAKEMLEQLDKMSNIERNDFLDTLYEEYFRTASDEQMYKDAKILQAYYEGELVYVENEYGY